MSSKQYKFSEFLFTGKYAISPEIEAAYQDQAGGFTGCADAINQSISNTEMEIRKELYSNILVTGGNF